MTIAKFQEVLDEMKSSGFTVAVAIAPKHDDGIFRVFSEEDEMEIARLEDLLTAFEKMEEIINKRIKELEK